VSKGIDRAAGAEREVTGISENSRPAQRKSARAFDAALGGEPLNGIALSEPATDSARQWQGWGTALKPACEPIVLARKPLSEKTVAANVLKWGTGAINVDGCRVESDESIPIFETSGGRKVTFDGRPQNVNQIGTRNNGRWPANVIHDGSEEVVAAFPDSDHARGNIGESKGGGGMYGHDLCINNFGAGDEGSTARFFYTAKADGDDRLGSKHPTVKPLDLMQYLVRLITPKGGMVIDPFAGTGTTGEAAFREGFRAVLIEREEEYQADIRRRIKLCMAGPDERKREATKAKQADKPVDAGPLFGGGQDG
jgi:DNA methylase